MAMRGGKIPIFTVRMRMERLEERTNDTVLPPIDDLFRKGDPEPGLTQELMNNMTFSQYPGAKEFSASSLKAFLSNTNNLSEMRGGGSVGAILEVLRRTDVKSDPTATHITNLVESLHILVKDDMAMKMSLITHPFGTKTVIRLCKHCVGKMQELAFDMLEWIHRIDPPRGSNGPQKELTLDKKHDKKDQERGMHGGIHELLKHKIIKVLLHPTFMFCPTTNLSVRHRAGQMIAQLTPFSPPSFNVDHFNWLLIDPDTGRRRVDGKMEMFLLSAFLCHMSWRDKHAKGFLPNLLTIVSSLIQEVMSESFERYVK